MKLFYKSFEKKQTKLTWTTRYMKHLDDSRKFYKIIKAFFSDKGMNSNKMMIIEKDKFLSGKGSIAEVINNYFVDISESLNLKDSSESNVDNTGINCGHSLNDVLFEDHVRVKIIREKATNNGEFRSIQSQLMNSKR